MGATQAAAVAMYCTDPAHGDTFKGVVDGNVLTVHAEHTEVVIASLTEAANSLDDEAQDRSRSAEDRRTARAWRDSVQRLTKQIRWRAA